MAIVGDWGTSHLRLYRLEGGAVTARFEGPGIGALARPPADVLARALAQLGGGVGVVTLCGMAGSRNGLVEAPYLDCPADAAGWRGALVETEVAGSRVRIAPGLACIRPDGAPDVMRGEETKLFGLPALRPALSTGRHLVAMAGTHPKWAVLEGGRVLHFHTMFTGELFAWASTASTLARAGGEAGGADGGFAAGLARAGEGRGPVAGMFEARAAQLRAGRTLGWAQGFLSGLLIGGEVAEAARLFGPLDRVTLLAGAALAPLYGQALEQAGAGVDAIDGDEAVLAGLARLADEGDGR